MLSKFPLPIIPHIDFSNAVSIESTRPALLFNYIRSFLDALRFPCEGEGESVGPLREEGSMGSKELLDHGDN